MKRVLTCAAVGLLALGASVAIADKLSDFRDAVTKEGCESIPYSDLRGNCTSQQSYVHDWCDGNRGPVTCDSENVTRELKANLERERKKLETLKDKKRSLEDERGRATEDSEKERLAKEIEQVGRDIYDTERRVDQAVRDLEARKKHVDDAIYTLGKCLDYRRAVMNVFAAAIDKVRGENDDEIKPLARELRDKWEAGKRGHEIQITSRENALDTCKRSQP